MSLSATVPTETGLSLTTPPEWHGEALLGRLFGRYGYFSKHKWVFPRGDIRLMDRADGLARLEWRLACQSWRPVEGSVLWPLRAVTGLGDEPVQLSLPFTSKTAPLISLHCNPSKDWEETGVVSESFELTWYWRSRRQRACFGNQDGVSAAEYAVMGLLPHMDFLEGVFEDVRGHPELGVLEKVIEGFRQGFLR